MNRLLFPALLALLVVGGAFVAVQPPAPPPASPSAGLDVEAAAPHLERIMEGFLARVRGHNAPLPVTELEARRLEAMMGALNLEVPRGTIQAGSSLSEVARAAAGRLSSAQLAQLPGLSPVQDGGPSRELPNVVPGTEGPDRRSAELRLNGVPLDPVRARQMNIKPGDSLDAAGAVFYPVRIGQALVEFRDASRLLVRENELELAEGQILIRTQETGSSINSSSRNANANASATNTVGNASSSAARSALANINSPNPNPNSNTNSNPGLSSPLAPWVGPTGGPAPAPFMEANRFRVQTPHAEMIDVGTAFVATAERRRSRAEVLLGRVIMKSKRTGAWLELEPGEFAWTEDDGSLGKRTAELLFQTTQNGVVGSNANVPGGTTGSPGPGTPSVVIPPPDIISEDSTLIPSGALPTPVPLATVLPTPTPTPTPDPTASPDLAVPTPTPTQAGGTISDPTRSPLLNSGGFIGGGVTATPTPTPPVTPTPVPTDTQ